MNALPCVVVRTGVANLASVLAGLRRAGADPHVARDPSEVEDAAAVLLPGVGAFDAGIDALEAAGMADALRRRVAADRPLLAVCLGMQLLCDGSEESAVGRAGLGVVPGVAVRFTESVRVPQMGWNQIVADPGCAVLANGNAYFANSYRLVDRPPGYLCALANHGSPFVAAVELGQLVACQFHPELSGAFGRALLARFVRRAREADR